MLEGDLWEFYRIDVSDVFRGSLSPRRALVFVERLEHEPRSHYRAEILGTTEHIGWGQAERVAADLVDAVNVNTAATIAVAQQKPKLKEPTPYPRPGDDKDGQPKPAAESIADLPVHDLMN